MPTASSSESSRPASSDASSRQAQPHREAPSRVAIQGFTPEQVVERVGCELTTARKIVAGVNQRGDDVLGLRMPKMSRRKDVDAIAAQMRVGKLSVVAREASALDPFVKYVLESEDGARIEAVRIPLEKPGRFV